MKKLTFFPVCLCLSFALFSQVEQGKLLIGASVPVSGGLENLVISGRNGGAGLSLVTQKGEDGGKAKSVTIGLSPIIGYAAADNLLIGVGVNLLNSVTKGEDKEDGKITYSIYSLEPQARYYLPGAIARPFLEAGASFGQVKTKYEDTGFFDGEDKVNLSSFRGGAGLAIFFNPAASLDLTLSYQSGSLKDPDINDSKITASAFGLNAGFSWFLK